MGRTALHILLWYWVTEKSLMMYPGQHITAGILKKLSEWTVKSASGQCTLTTLKTHHYHKMIKINTDYISLVVVLVVADSSVTRCLVMSTTRNP